MLASGTTTPSSGVAVTPQQVGITLLGPYLLGVEIASMLLLGALVGAYHLGRRDLPRTIDAIDSHGHWGGNQMGERGTGMRAPDEVSAGHSEGGS